MQGDSSRGSNEPKIKVQCAAPDCRRNIDDKSRQWEVNDAFVSHALTLDPPVELIVDTIICTACRTRFQRRRVPPDVAAKRSRDWRAANALASAAALSTRPRRDHRPVNKDEASTAPPHAAKAKMPRGRQPTVLSATFVAGADDSVASASPPLSGTGGTGIVASATGTGADATGTLTAAVTAASVDDTAEVDVNTPWRQCPQAFAAGFTLRHTKFYFKTNLVGFREAYHSLQSRNRYSRMLAAARSAGQSGQVRPFSWRPSTTIC